MTSSAFGFDFGFGFGEGNTFSTSFEPSDISGLVLELIADNITDTKPATAASVAITCSGPGTINEATWGFAANGTNIFVSFGYDNNSGSDISLGSDSTDPSSGNDGPTIAESLRFFLQARYDNLLGTNTITFSRSSSTITALTSSTGSSQSLGEQIAIGGITTTPSFSQGTDTGPEGAHVTTFPDSSGHSNNAIQASSTLQPILHTDGPNGHWRVAFDGVDDYLDAPLANTQPYHVFIVAETPSDFSVYRALVDGVSSGQRGFVGYSITTGALTLFAGLLVSGASIPTGFHIITALLASPAKALVDGSVNISSGNPGSNATTSTRLGASGSLDSFFPKSLCAVLIYNRTLTDPEILEVNTYLSDFYGIAIS